MGSLLRAKILHMALKLSVGTSYMVSLSVLFTHVVTVIGVEMADPITRML